MFIKSTSFAEGIFRKEGIVPGSTIFVGLAVAYDLGGFLGLHRLLGLGFCEQNKVFHCDLRIQNIRILFNPFLCHNCLDPGCPFRLRDPDFTQQVFSCGLAFRVILDVHDLGHAVLELFALRDLGSLRVSVKSVERVRETPDVSLGTLPDRVLRLFPETLNEFVLEGRRLDLVPDRVEHAAVRPVTRVTDLRHVLPCLHVGDHAALVGLVLPCGFDLHKDLRICVGREFRTQRVRVNGDLHSVDVLAVVVKHGAIRLSTKSSRSHESTPAGFVFLATALDALVQFALATLVAGSFAVAYACRHETPAFVCRDRCGDTCGIPCLKFLPAALSPDAVSAASFAFAKAASTAPSASEFGVLLEFSCAACGSFAKVEVLFANSSSVHAWTRAILMNFLLHAIDAARFSHGARLCFPP